MFIDGNRANDIILENAANNIIFSEVLRESNSISPEQQEKYNNIIDFNKFNSKVERRMAKVQKFIATSTEDEIINELRKNNIDLEKGETKFDFLEKLPRSVKAKIAISEREMIPVIHKILIRVAKSPANIFTIINEEIQFNSALRGNTDESEYGYLMLAFVFVLNSLIAAILIAGVTTMAGFSAALLLLVAVVAPLTEEIGRSLSGKGHLEFTTGINVAEFIMYVMRGATFSQGLIIGAMRVLVSQPLHTANTARLAKAERSGGSRILATIINIGVHATFNLLAVCCLPLFIIGNVGYALYSTASNSGKISA